MTDSSEHGGDRGSRSERLDTMFHVLADEDRRHVIRYFTSHEECSASLDDLIEYVRDRDGDNTTREGLQRRFHHFTLPKLVEHGVIEFDHRSRTVRYRAPEVYGEVLGAVEESDLHAE